jgi:hypothetical protein
LGNASLVRRYFLRELKELKERDSIMNILGKRSETVINIPTGNCLYVCGIKGSGIK